MKKIMIRKTEILEIKARNTNEALRKAPKHKGRIITTSYSVEKE